MISWYRGVLVLARRTADITHSVMINVEVLAGVMVLLRLLLPMPGALLAAVSLAASVTAEACYLRFRSARCRLAEPAEEEPVPANG